MTKDQRLEIKVIDINENYLIGIDQIEQQKHMLHLGIDELDGVQIGDVIVYKITEVNKFSSGMNFVGIYRDPHWIRVSL